MEFNDKWVVIADCGRRIANRWRNSSPPLISKRDYSFDGISIGERQHVLDTVGHLANESSSFITGNTLHPGGESSFQ